MHARHLPPRCVGVPKLRTRIRACQMVRYVPLRPRLSYRCQPQLSLANNRHSLLGATLDLSCSFNKSLKAICATSQNPTQQDSHIRATASLYTTRSTTRYLISF